MLGLHPHIFGCAGANNSGFQKPYDFRSHRGSYHGFAWSTMEVIFACFGGDPRFNTPLARLAIQENVNIVLLAGGRGIEFESLLQQGPIRLKETIDGVNQRLRRPVCGREGKYLRRRFLCPEIGVHVGATKTVDRLLWIADHHQPVPRERFLPIETHEDRFEDLELSWIGILGFVDQPYLVLFPETLNEGLAAYRSQRVAQGENKAILGNLAARQERRVYCLADRLDTTDLPRPAEAIGEIRDFFRRLQNRQGGGLRLQPFAVLAHRVNVFR